MNYVVNKYKLIIAALCCIIFASIAVLLFLWKAYLLACIFLILCIVYLVVALQNGNVVRVDRSGVSRRFPPNKLSMSWEDISEVGVVGLRVLNSKGKRYTGSRYIYVSRKPLSEEERFNMCLKWPPQDVLYFRFSYKRIAAVQKLWEREIVMFNTGNLQF